MNQEILQQVAEYTGSRAATLGGAGLDLHSSSLSDWARTVEHIAESTAQYLYLTGNETRIFRRTFFRAFIGTTLEMANLI